MTKSIVLFLVVVILSAIQLGQSQQRDGKLYHFNCHRL